MKYTKGFWKARPRNILSNSLFSHTIEVDEQVVARVEGETNAHLIAAAPNQNQALREIDQWLIDNPDVSDDPQLHTIHIHIQDSLAKAKGE